MFDVVALGELLIDFTACGKSATDKPIFEANPGGAPCNALAMLAKLGKSTAFIGKVGNDMFGTQLRQALDAAGISCQGLVMDSKFNTTLAFVNNKPDGDREFSFYRANGADTMLTANEVNDGLIKAARLFHFGSLSFTHPAVKAATIHGVALAKQNKLLISFDPNLRPALWQSMQMAKEEIVWGIKQCHILKLSEMELFFVSNETQLQQAAQDILQTFTNVKVLVVTCGKDGSYAFCNSSVAFCPSSKHKAIDTTGAGDTFFGCCLSYIIDNGILLDQNNMQQMLSFANIAAGIVTTRKGAMSVMPSLQEILAES